ncbi:hypothetical protein CEXT_798521 [Caerostris extrusa]|uniref:Uncharacterized protein n=1 Tax=Caerostris extrusa TaxID=172846 RepID=A0AAV4Q225_CAEEX|nr:hypothetical protein CEXT_798521 [Caerostris extrusa]
MLLIHKVQIHTIPRAEILPTPSTSNLALFTHMHETRERESIGNHYHALNRQERRLAYYLLYGCDTRSLQTQNTYSFPTKSSEHATENYAD